MKKSIFQALRTLSSTRHFLSMARVYIIIYSVYQYEHAFMMNHTFSPYSFPFLLPPVLSLANCYDSPQHAISTTYFSMSTSQLIIIIISSCSHIYRRGWSGRPHPLFLQAQSFACLAAILAQMLTLPYYTRIPVHACICHNGANGGKSKVLL